MTIPSKPIIVFSESSTGHWFFYQLFILIVLLNYTRDKNQCKKGPHVVTKEEKDLLEAKPFKVATELNRDELNFA